MPKTHSGLENSASKAYTATTSLLDSICWQSEITINSDIKNEVQPAQATMVRHIKYKNNKKKTQEKENCSVKYMLLQSLQWICLPLSGGQTIPLM